MIRLGNWLDVVDTDEGRAQFKKTYDVDVYQYMIEHDVTNITLLYYLRQVLNTLRLLNMMVHLMKLIFLSIMSISWFTVMVA